MKFPASYRVEDSLKEHNQAWSKLLSENRLSEIGVATTLSLKVSDKSQLFALIEANQANIEQVHIGTVGERYIASAKLLEPYQGMQILKILERRPGSADRLGLDSVDYLVADIEACYQELKTAKLSVVKESNEMHNWLSLRFGNKQQFEAKFTDHLVLEVAIKELRFSSLQISSALNHLQK